jgi:hypothetical protein
MILSEARDPIAGFFSDQQVRIALHPSPYPLLFAQRPITAENLRLRTGR